MNKFVKLFYLILISGLYNCNPSSRQLVINIDSKYNGWVYLIPAKIPIKENYKIDSNSIGIIYLSDSLFFKDKKNIKLVIKKNDTVYQSTPIKLYDISFYPRGSQYKVMYQQFYFPLTNNDALNDDSLYIYKQDMYNTIYVNEFEYYFLTGVIDTNKIKRWY